MGSTGWASGERMIFELIESDELLLGLLREPGLGNGHGFERAAEAPSALEGRLGHAAHFAVVAGEEADDEVGFLHRPGAQDDGFAGEDGHSGTIIARGLSPIIAYKPK